MKKVLLRMNNVSLEKREFGSTLQDFNLKIYEGEIINLLGTANSGKTSFYKFLTGEEMLLDGKVEFGNSTCRSREYFNNKGRVLCIGQKITLIENLNIAENLCLVNNRTKFRKIISKKEIFNKASMILDKFDISLKADTLVKDLTEVEKRIVELLRFWVSEATLVYIDDVYSHFGQIDLGKLIKIIIKLRELNISVIYASRVKDPLSILSNRIVVIRKGVNVKNYYKNDYDENNCRRWIVGNSTLVDYKGKVYKTDEVVLETVNLVGNKYIDKANIKIHKGEIVGFYDMNNIANLEFANLLIGENKINLGEIFLDGKAYKPKNIFGARKLEVGYIPRNRLFNGVVETMDFKENLLLPIMTKMSLFRVFQNKRVKKFLEKEYIEELGIDFAERNKETNYFDSYIKTNIIFKKWVLAKPKVIICEDICEETDIIMKNIIYKSISELAKNKTAVIITSKSLSELHKICDTIYIMNSYDNNKRIAHILKIYNQS